MGVVVGLLLGIGLFCVWWSFWAPARQRPRTPGGRYDRALDTMNQAGLESVSLRTLAVTCAGLGLAAFAGALAVSRRPGHRRVLRRHGRRGAGGGRPRPRTTPSAAAARRVARGRGQPRRPASGPGCRCRRRWRSSPTAVRSRCARRSRRSPTTTGRRDASVMPRRAQGTARRPGRGPDLEALRITREVGGTDLGRLLRSLSDVPARGRPHPRGAGGAAELDGQRRAARGRRAVAGPRAAARPAPRPSRRTPGRPASPSWRSAAASTVVAYRLMVRIGRLPEEARVLR